MIVPFIHLLKIFTNVFGAVKKHRELIFVGNVANHVTL